MGLRLLCGAAALFGASVQALAFPGPQPTDAFQALPLDGWSPRPTAAPAPAVAHELLRRQQNILPATYLLAPDNTCGFINGISKSAYACVETGMKCVFITASGKVPGAAGCCSGSNCMFRISCIADADIDDDCDSACQADALTLKCTGSAKFCATVDFPANSVTDYYCTSKKPLLALKALTTYLLQTGRSMSTVKVTSTSTKSSSTTSSKSSSSTGSTSQSSSTSSGTSSSAEPSTTSATNTAVAGSATSSAPPEATAASSTPVGGIVGGVIGGIAGIALIVLAAILLRRHKKKNDVTELPPPQPFMSEPSFSAGKPPAPSYSQTNASSRMSYELTPQPMPSATSTPAHMYAAPAAAAAGGAVAGAAAAGAFNSYQNQRPGNGNGYDNNGPGYANNGNGNGNGYPNNGPGYANNGPGYANAAPGYANNGPEYANNGNGYPHNGSGYANNGPNYANGAGYPNSAYADPSPVSTPAQSPAPQFHHQPHAPQPLPQPSYYNQANHSPSPSQAENRPWTSGAASTVDPPDRRSTSTPVSSYNGTIPVTPASALGPMPGEQQPPLPTAAAAGGAMAGVPLSLQPGMGYRPYRPGGSSTAPSRSGSGSVDGTGLRSVSGSTPPPPVLEGPQIAQAAVVHQPGQVRAVAVELP